MSEMKFLMIFPAIMVTLALLNMVTTTEGRTADPGSAIVNSIQDATKRMNIMRAGLSRGLGECQRLYKDELWDCSFYNKSVTGNLPDFVQRTLPYANKETAFLHAITTAGILQEIVSQCAANKITECSCDKKAQRTSRCGNNLTFAAEVTLNLLRTRPQGNNDRREIDEKNQNVGIEVFKGNYKNCLSRVPKKCDKWQEVAKELKNKYQSAVKSNNVQQQQLSMGKVFRRNHMQLLVLTYQDSSPDYCQRNVTAGSPGLEGRVCGNDRKKTRHCRSLCRQCGLKLMRERRGSPINTVTVCRQRKRSHQNRKGHNKGNRSP